MNKKHDLNLLLLQAAIQAKHGLISTANKYNLTLVQALTLCLLEPEKVVPMHSISDMLVCDASNATIIVDKLVANDFIERKESSTDRRVNTINLTDQGEKARDDLLANVFKDYLPNVAQLSAAEKETLTNLLVKILSSS